MRSRRWWFALPFVLCLFALWFLHRPVLIFLGEWLDVGETPRAVDFVMVLPGGPERRPFVATAMVRAGLARGVLTAQTLSEPANDSGLLPASDAVFKRAMILRGIREDQIQVLEGKSKSTWTDALALAQFLRAHPNATVAIVTDGFHTRRSKWSMQGALGKDAQRVYYISAPAEMVMADSWWTTEEGLVTYIGEYFKLLFYVMSDLNVLALAFALSGLTWMTWQFWQRRRRQSRAQHSAQTP